MAKIKYRSRKNLLSRAEALQRLEAFLPGFVEDLDESWAWVQQILEEDPERRLTFDTSLEAAMVNCRFVNRVRQRLSSLDEVKVKMYGRHMTVHLGEDLKLRFKKFDRLLRSGNVRTNRQFAIYHQLAMDGVIPDPTDVTFGYVTTVAGDSLAGVYVTCPIGWSTNAWMIAIRDRGIDSIPLFDAPRTPDEPSVIVRPRRLPKVEGDTENNE